MNKIETVVETPAIFDSDGCILYEYKRGPVVYINELAIISIVPKVLPVYFQHKFEIKKSFFGTSRIISSHTHEEVDGWEITMIDGSNFYCAKNSLPEELK